MNIDYYKHDKDGPYGTANQFEMALIVMPVSLTDVLNSIKYPVT